MEIFEIGKLEGYINAGQEARVPIAYKALKAGDNGAAGGPRADTYGPRLRPERTRLRRPRLPR
jgi:hypothetical protein